MAPRIDHIFVGGPKTMSDVQGTWRSSIQRERRDGPVHVTAQGIVGDKVTQPYHGGPHAALCVYLADHYRFWNSAYGLALGPGAVGENLTVSGLTETDICVADTVRCGTVLAQVSGPRVPCMTLARHVGRADWVRRTVQENRTGFYMRVLEAGTIGPGDAWLLEERIHKDATISRMNRCMYLEFDAAFAQSMLQMTGLGEWWREQAQQKLFAEEEHWTLQMMQGPDV